jgi:hypothetical protein
MTTFREDLREAFDVDQRRLGDLAGARQRLMQDAMASRDAGRRGFQWAAGVAALLLAAIVITTFALVRAGSHSHPVPAATPSPSANASPTPLRNLLNVPDSTPIITYGDPAKPNQVDGMTWDGSTRGQLSYQPAGSGNPANNLFAEPPGIYDRSGRLIASGTFGPKYFAGTWADDEQQFCQMVPYDYLGANGVPATLQIVRPGQAPRDVTQVAKIYEQGVTSVAACSVLNDRAVVVQSFGNGGPAQLWVVRISTGKILWSRSFDPGSSPAAIVVSHDGMYVAENLSGPGLPVVAAGSTILGADGKQVAHLAEWVEAFSWDGSLAVVDDGWTSGSVSLVRWADGNSIWEAPAGYALVRVLPEPEGVRLAIWVMPSAELKTLGPGPLHSDLYVIAPDGTIVTRIHDTP